MNLQENIYRIQSLLTENKGTVIKSMIDKHGLYDTIKMVGNYDIILNSVGHEYFSNEDKINFIIDVISFLCKRYNTTGISVYDLDMSPVTFGTLDPNGLEFQQIEYFNVDFVSIDVYDRDSHQGGFTEKYKHLDDKTLDNVFIFMIDALEKFT